MLIPETDCRMIFRAAVLLKDNPNLKVGFDARHTRSDNYVMRLYFFTLDEKGGEKIILKHSDVSRYRGGYEFPTYMYGRSKDSEDAETHLRRLYEYEELLDCAGFCIDDARIKIWRQGLGSKKYPVYDSYIWYRDKVKSDARSMPLDEYDIRSARNTVYQELVEFVVSRKSVLEKKEDAITKSLKALYEVFEMMDKETFKFISLQCSGLPTDDKRVKELSGIRAEILKIKKYNQEIADYSQQITTEKAILGQFLSKMRWTPREPFSRRQFRTKLSDAMATLYVSIGEIKRG